MRNRWNDAKTRRASDALGMRSEHRVLVSPRPQSSGIDACGEPFFDPARVLELELKISENALPALRGYRWQWNRQNALPRPWVEAEVSGVGGRSETVRLRLEGAAGSFRTIDDRPSMALHFERSMGKFSGCQQLLLSNSVQDPSHCNERIARQLFLDAGVPTGNATHARVWLNGRDLGIYVVVEEINRSFVRRHFGKRAGSLYDGGFLQDIDTSRQPESFDRLSGPADLRPLNEAVQTSDLGQREEHFTEILDLDRFLSHLALDVILYNWAGYHLNRNNYRVHCDAERGKFTFLPSGLDQLFEQPDGPVHPMFLGRVTQAVMAIPSMRTAFFERILELTRDQVRGERLLAMIEEIAVKIRENLQVFDRAAIPAYLREVDDLKTRVIRRLKSVRSQLSQRWPITKNPNPGYCH